MCLTPNSSIGDCCSFLNVPSSRIPSNERQETWPILDYFINIITSYLRILTSDVMLQFLKEIVPVARMLVNQKQKLGQKIENSRGNTEEKRDLYRDL
jgi:hypothetical protein